jgi:hypothetical protein
MAINPYITREQFEFVVRDLNYEGGTDRMAELLARATGDLESDLARKFVVPLVPRGASRISSSPQAQNYAFANAKVLNAMKAKLRAIIGYDQNRNLTGTIENTEKFLNVHEIEYKNHIKDLLDNKIDFGFTLLGQAEDAQTPVQHLALSRANNDSDPYGNGWGNGWQ